MNLKTIPWTQEEKKFVRLNHKKGLAWIVQHIRAATGTKRSENGIRRMAHLLGYSLVVKVKKKAVKKKSHGGVNWVDTEAKSMKDIRFANQNMW